MKNETSHHKTTKILIEYIEISKTIPIKSLKNIIDLIENYD